MLADTIQYRDPATVFEAKASNSQDGLWVPDPGGHLRPGVPQGGE
jgi:hypothetical protein